MKHVQTVNLPPRALFNRLMHSVQATFANTPR